MGKIYQEIQSTFIQHDKKSCKQAEELLLSLFYCLWNWGSDCLRSLSFQVVYIDLYSRSNILLTLPHQLEFTEGYMLFSYFFLHFLSSFFSSIFFFKDIFSIIYLFLIFLAMQCQTCGILVPWARIQSRPLAVKLRSPSHWTTRKLPSIIYSWYSLLIYLPIIMDQVVLKVLKWNA